MTLAIKRRLCRLNGGRNLTIERELAALTDYQLDDLLAVRLPDPVAYLAMPSEERSRWLSDHKKET
jgi:hypothetical protein